MDDKKDQQRLETVELLLKITHNPEDMQANITAAAASPAHDLPLQSRAGPLPRLVGSDGLHASNLAALLLVQEHLVLDVVPALQHLQSIVLTIKLIIKIQKNACKHIAVDACTMQNPCTI